MELEEPLVAMIHEIEAHDVGKEWAVISTALF
jgi:hypothetical protein